jgi:hypothetical protein
VGGRSSGVEHDHGGDPADAYCERGGAGERMVELHLDGRRLVLALDQSRRVLEGQEVW